MNDIRCVIFDCDGTLVDSEGLSDVALVMELKKLGIHECVDGLSQRYNGWRLQDICADLEGIYKINLGEAFVGSYRRTMEEVFGKHLRSIPGVKEALSLLDIPLCVASNGPMSKIKTSLSLTGLEVFFGPHLYSAYDVAAWKPDPALLLHAAAKMGVSPCYCAVVEDTAIGIEAGINAGMRVFWFNRFHLPPCGFEPVTVFNRMHDLAAHLGY